MSKQTDAKAKGCQRNGMSQQRDVKAWGCHSTGMSKPSYVEAMGCQSEWMPKQGMSKEWDVTAKTSKHRKGMSKQRDAKA